MQARSSFMSFPEAVLAKQAGYLRIIECHIKRRQRGCEAMVDCSVMLTGRC